MITPLQPPDDQLAIVLGQRQLVAICCMALVVLGLVATLSYVCGRSITAAQMRQQETLPPQAIVVDPAKPAPSGPATQSASVPSALEARAETLPLQPPTSAPSQPAATQLAAAQPALQPQTPRTAVLGEPTRGLSFWQVGVVDRGVATVFAEYLTRLGLKARLAAGDSPTTHRVLVGPLPDQAETENTRRILQSAGFQYFLRRY
jgi:cell division protein FtsN